MIRILFMSDLHLEMERWRLSVPGWSEFMSRHRGITLHPSRGPLLNDLGRVDLVVLAGDIYSGLRSVVYAEQVSRYLDAPVVMVAGNHEYYHHDVATLLPALRAAAGHSNGRVQFLENTRAEYDFSGKKLAVLGCTLWTNYALSGDSHKAMRDAQLRMNDHNYITMNGAVFSPQDARAIHEASFDWLLEDLAAVKAQDPGIKKIIVTHHAPSSLVLGARQGAIAPAYASELIGEFSETAPDLWIHGHTHYRHDSYISGVRLMSAPRGYVGYDGDNALLFRPGMTEI